jgi:Uma2 family endonuclease
MRQNPVDDGLELVRETQCVVAYGVSWASYMKVLHALDHNKVWMTFDEPTLEMRKVSLAHERARLVLSQLFTTAAEMFDRSIISLGRFTWRSRKKRCGLEADGSYYVANAERMQPVRQVDLAIHPPPDLAIEIELSSSEVDRLRVYQKLGVPEIWRYDGRELVFLALRGDGYVSMHASESLPDLTPALLAEFLELRHDIDDTTLRRRFRERLVSTWPDKCVDY